MTFKNPSRAAVTLTIGMVLLLATTIFAQQLSGTRSEDSTTAKLVCEMVQRHHISDHRINDDTSKMLLERFLDELDHQKLYFMHSDVEELRKYERELDDLLKVGNVDFAYATYDVYQRRLDERIKLAQQLIDAEHDFTIDEQMIFDPDELNWAKTEAEIHERWRKKIKADLLLLKLDDTTLAEARGQLHKRYKNIHNIAHQIEDFEKLETYLSSLTHCFDPHSSYMSPQTLEDFRISMELSLEGIGASLRSEDGFTIVHQIVPGGAADKDGRLQVDDRILAVGQENGEWVDIVEMKLNRVVRYIRGKKGTTVRLKVKKADTGELEVYEMIRQKVELKQAAVRGEIINTGDRLAGTATRVGVINIPSFYRDFRGAQKGIENFKSTSRDVKKVLKQFRDQGGVDAVIVDLRTNGGGALSEAIEVSGLFIDEGPVVQVKERDGGIKSHNDVVEGVAFSGPVVVLCNRLSASASEIFAGVIKDYSRGIVVGDTTTHGKGTVQNVMPVSKQFLFLRGEDRGALKLTINQFHRVNGDSTQNRGVQSDIVLPSLLDHMDLGESFLDNALEFVKVEPAEYKRYDLVNAELISTLRQASQRRVQADPEFQDELAEIEKYVAKKKRKTISLNEEVRRGEIQDDKRDDEEEEDPRDENGNRPVFPEGHYNDEVLAITVDYANQLNRMVTAGK